GFEPGVEITGELIAANPDAALEHIQLLVAERQKQGEVIVGLQSTVDAHKGDRDALEDLTTRHAEAERRAADASGELEGLRNRLADSEAQRTSLLTGNSETLAAYRDLALAANPTLPPSLVAGGTLA